MRLMRQNDLVSTDSCGNPPMSQGRYVALGPCLKDGADRRERVSQDGHLFANVGLLRSVHQCRYRYRRIVPFFEGKYC